MSASDRQPRFHAFISYSHQQRDVAIWLHRLLERYWVPGYRQRTVFLDREHLAANELAPMILAALEQSRFLIVLCSNDARGSTWVDREVDHFVAKHGIERVLGVRVGLADDAAMPASLEHHQALAGKLVPRLYGTVSSWDRSVRRARELDALALLGSILGVDKSAITARRKRVWILASVALVSAATVTGAWFAWLHGSADGGFYRARIALLADAASHRADDPELVRAAYAAGRIGDQRLLAALADSAAEAGSAGQLRLAGNAGAGLDCAILSGQLAAIDPSVARAWPLAAVLAGRNCPSLLIPESEPSAQMDALMAARRFEAVLPMLANERIDTIDRLKVAVILRAIDVLPAKVEREPGAMLLALLAQSHPADAAGTVADVVEQHWDLLATRSAQMLALIAHAGDRLLSMHAHGELEWSLAAKLAALALLHGDPALAHSLRAPLRAMDETLARVPHCAAIGLAWAALADSAFDRNGSDQLLAQAQACGSAEQPMSKTWEEWHTIAKALTEQNRWREAWALPAEVRDTGARMRLTADLMDRYAHSHCRTQSIVFTPWPTHVADCAAVRETDAR